MGQRPKFFRGELETTVSAKDGHTGCCRRDIHIPDPNFVAGRTSHSGIIGVDVTRQVSDRDIFDQDVMRMRGVNLVLLPQFAHSRNCLVGGGHHSDAAPVHANPQ